MVLKTTYEISAALERWGEYAEPSWIHADEVTAPAAGTALVSKTVSSGKKGYIFGFLITAQEANDFKINWTSGGTDYSIRLVFGAGGSTESVDPVGMNWGLPADENTDITITNVNAGSANTVYQCRLLFLET